MKKRRNGAKNESRKEEMSNLQQVPFLHPAIYIVLQATSIQTSLTHRTWQ